MIRAFYDGELEIGKCCQLERNEAHHVFRVLRAQPSETIQLLDGHGTVATGLVEQDQTVYIQQIQLATASRINFYPALLKSKAMDFLIREATAIGVRKISPLISDHSEAKIHDLENKLRHWNDIAREACKQSGNVFLPAIEPPQKLSKIIFPQLTFVAALHPPARPVLDYYQELRQFPAGTEIGVVIGPEGDFSEREYKDFEAQKLRFVTLSRQHILRSETAALYLLSLVDQLQMLPSSRYEACR
ncbi:MAG: 16S rRNA (uracil(1498)-N(3))-methyltransferase [Opitutales bacterium]|nr:16S rRNA (uracil(1498)-N(3))-methyltransferase [Opitutales bacterium]